MITAQEEELVAPQAWICGWCANLNDAAVGLWCPCVAHGMRRTDQIRTDQQLPPSVRRARARLARECR